MKNNPYKGNLDIILMKLLSENGKMYGYEMMQKIKAVIPDDLKITEAGLYAALHKMEAKGHLDVEFVQVDNRKRKYYKLTEKGQKQFSIGLEELKIYLKNMAFILKNSPAFKM